MKKAIIILFCFLSLTVKAQTNTRPTPLENVVLKSDMNVNYKNMTNVNSVVFYENGSNLVVNMSMFMTLCNGNAIRLRQSDNTSSYLIVSNSAPYLITSNGIRAVTLNSDTAYIRQFEPSATITNLNIVNELIINWNYAFP